MSPSASRYTPRVHPFLLRLRAVLHRAARRAETLDEIPPEDAPAPLTHAPQEVMLDIKSATVVRIAILVLLGVMAFRVVGVLLLVLTSLIIASALMPIVDRLATHRWPRSLSALLLYVVGLGVLTTLVASVIPLVAEQVLDLARNTQKIVTSLIREGPQSLPFIGPYVAKLFGGSDPALLARDLQQPLQDLGKSLLGFTTDAVGAVGKLTAGLFDFIAVIIISFYLLVRRSLLEGVVHAVTPLQFRRNVLERHRVIVSRMGSWMRAQLLVMLFAFILSWIGFSIVGLEYSLFLSLLAGIFSIVPVVGWITAGILAALLGLTQSVWVFIGVIVVIFIVHFFEAYIFIPLVTERAVGLSPVAVLIALLLGAKLAGFLGVLLAVPIATAVMLLLEAPKRVVSHPAHADASAP